MWRLAAALALCPVLASAQAAVAPADEGDEGGAVPRRGYYLSLGLGSGGGSLSGAAGSRSLERYMGAPPFRVAASLEGGAAVGRRLLVGIDLTFFRATAREGTLRGAIQLVQPGLAATFYPRREGPFLRLSAGLARLELTSWGRGATYAQSGSGVGLVAGAGWAFDLWRSLDLTVRVDALYAWLDAPEVELDRSLLWVGYAGVSWF
jgi:hypothetical protein